MKQFPKPTALISALALLGLGSLPVVVWFDDREIVIESQESKTTASTPVFNKIKWIRLKEKDVWMMNQSHRGFTAHESGWDRLAIVVDRKTTPKTARFYQLNPGPLQWSENQKELPPKVSCFICHANGPRAIRPNLSSSFAVPSLNERLKIQLWNLRIKSYGRVMLDVEHDKRDATAIPPVRWRGDFENEPLKIATCVKCHKDSGLIARGTLKRQHLSTIRFMVESGHMPPLGLSLSAVERAELEKFLAGL